jgi:hypothetical protein
MTYWLMFCLYYYSLRCRFLQEEVIRQGQGNVELWGAEGHRKLVQGNGDIQYSI